MFDFGLFPVFCRSFVEEEPNSGDIPRMILMHQGSLWLKSRALEAL